MSAGVAFAVSEDNVAIGGVDEEIVSNDDVLSVEDSFSLNNDVEHVLEVNESSDVVGESSTVTNNTFFNYFESDGTLKSNVTVNELIFEGEFSNIHNVNYIVINKTIKFTGKNAVINNISFVIDSANDVAIDSFTINAADASNAIFVSSSNNVKIANNNITFNAMADDDSACAIYADAANALNFQSNRVTVVGTRSGNKILNFVDCVGAVVDDNAFVGVVPSTGYQTGAVHFDYGTSNLVFTNNLVDVIGTDQGVFSTTCAVVFAGNNVTFDNNDVYCGNDTYSYGVVVLGSDSTISGSSIKADSPVYACGVNLEGYGLTVVDDNEIIVSSEGTAYGIYSGMTSGGLSGNYSNNNISADAYFAVGVELGSPDENVVGNTIIVSGNYTVGVAAIPSISYLPPTWAPTPIPIANRVVKSNIITLNGSNVGDKSSGDSYIPAVTAGVYTVIGNMTLVNNTILSNDVGIYAESADNLILNLNAVYVNGTKVVDFVDCVGAVVDGNTFVGIVPSSGYQIGALHFDYGTSDLVFTENFVQVVGTEQGIYSTTCAVVFAGNNVTLDMNTIICSNCTYSYAIVALGSNSTISGSYIGAISPVYACGVNLEGNGWTVVDNNTIMAYSKGSAYGIYSGMTSGGLSGNYTNNKIGVNAYFAVGVELGSPDENVIGNTIVVMGNYTVGVAAIPSITYVPPTWAPTPIPITNRLVQGNNIISFGSNVGNKTSGDSYIPTVTIGIYAAIGNITIKTNNISANGDYAADLNGFNAIVEDNHLVAKKSVGSSSIANSKNAVISGSSPQYKTILSAVNLYTTYFSGDVYYVSLKDENGDAVVNATLLFEGNNLTLSQKTDTNGVAAFIVDEWDAGEYNVLITYKGNSTYGPKSIDGFISIEPRVSGITGVSSKTVLLTAVKSGSYVTVTLKDDRGIVLAGETVSITFDGKTANYTTSPSGVIKYKLAATKIGSKTLTVVFNSNDNYVPVTKSATVKLTKEASKLTAKAKTFKAKTKTKKYTVTLKDSKGKAIKKVKVTIKVKGKTYKATTGANGKATFKITKLTKKGKYTAKVKFAGNGYYKATSKKVKITIK